MNAVWRLAWQVGRPVVAQDSTSVERHDEGQQLPALGQLKRRHRAIFVAFVGTSRLLSRRRGRVVGDAGRVAFRDAVSTGFRRINHRNRALDRVARRRSRFTVQQLV